MLHCIIHGDIQLSLIQEPLLRLFFLPSDNKRNVLDGDKVCVPVRGRGFVDEKIITKKGALLRP